MLTILTSRVLVPTILMTLMIVLDSAHAIKIITNYRVAVKPTVPNYPEYSFPIQSGHRSELKKALLLVRGGGDIALSDNDDDDNILIKKLRTMIRTVLKVGDKKVPVVSKLLRGCIKRIEDSTGIPLLPKPGPAKKKKSKKRSKQFPSKKKGSKNVDVGEKEGTATKETKSQKTTAKMKKHLDTNLKTSNPNYRIQKELKEFIKSPPPNISVQVGTNLRVWIVTLKPAKNSIYEGETFKLRVSFPPSYPVVPPSVYFLQGYIPTHEHVYTNGDICLSLLGSGWRPNMTAQSIAVSIMSILSSANSKSLPMDNARHADNKPGEYQKDWVYHDDNC